MAESSLFYFLIKDSLELGQTLGQQQKMTVLALCDSSMFPLWASASPCVAAGVGQSELSETSQLGYSS